MKFLLRIALAAAAMLVCAASLAAPRVLLNCATLTDPGAYVVGRNISATGDCFVIAASFVNLDFDGFVVTGNGTGAAVTQTMVSPTEGRRGIVVKNGAITGFGSGVSLDWSVGARIENMTVSGNTGRGMVLGDGAAAVGNTVTHNGSDGIVFGNRALAQGNNVSNNANSGIYATNGANVTGNTVGQNQASGIYAGEGAVISNNVSRSNGAAGISVTCPSLVFANTASNNQGVNLYAGGSVCEPDSVLCCVRADHNMVM